MRIFLYWPALFLGLSTTPLPAQPVPSASPQNTAVPELTKPPEPNQSGPVQLICASWLGGAGEDEIVGVGITPDQKVVLAGNGGVLKLAGITPAILGQAEETAASPVPEKPGTDAPDTAGFIAILTADGQHAVACAQFPAGVVKVKKIKLDEAGNIYVLGEARRPLALGEVIGTGTFAARLAPDLRTVKFCLFQDGAIDFDVDEHGEMLFLTKGHLVRYPAGDGGPLWDVTWPAHGDNRPGGLALDQKSGVAAVVGYGMAHTGHEPWKDPYAVAFDRAGKPVWTLWNPDPAHQADARFGGTGLMADTTGKFVGHSADGHFFLGLYADGGNTVTMRNPHNENEPLAAEVMAGVHQNGPGFGFKGASSTAVIFRANASTGELEKGTFMSAWLTPQRANGLAMDAATGSAQGLTFVVGGSAYGCPTKNPWYLAPPGGYQGGGYLAVFDDGFKMLQCGYFPGTELHRVAERDGMIVIGGQAIEKVTVGNAAKGEPVLTYAVPIYRPLQETFGGGKKDGYFAIFKVTR